MMKPVPSPYTQQRTYTGSRLDAYNCNEPGCKAETFLSRQEMIVHLAVVHGIRPVTKERLDAQQV